MKNMMLLKVLGIINKLPSRKKMLKMQLLLTIFVFSGSYLSALLLEKFYVNMAKSLNSFAFPVLYLISVLIFKFIINLMELYFMPNLEMLIKSDLYVKVNEALHNSKKIQGNTSEYLSNILQNVEIVTEILSRWIYSFFSSFILLLLFLVVIFNVDIITGILYTLTVLASAITHIFFYSKMGMEKTVFLEITNKSNSYLSQAISGIREIRSFGLEEMYIRNVLEFNDGIVKNQLKYEKTFMEHEIFNNLLCYLCEIIPIYIGLILVSTGSSEIGKTAFLIQFTQNIIIFMTEFSESYCKIKSSKNEVNKISDLLNTESLKVKKDQSKENVEITNSKIALEIKNLTAFYGKNKVLDDISFSVLEGETVAIIGKSGSGKSTLLKILSGFMENYDGKYFLLGKEVVKDVSESFIRDNVSYVSQNEVLFDFSIEDNIRIGKSDISNDEIGRILKKVNMHKEVEELCNGIKTVIGEEGTALSGGQIQRICIARALAKDTCVFLFDEITSSLDKKNERKIMEELKKMKNKTILMSTHSREILPYASKIIILKEGKIEVKGSFDELYKIEDYFKEEYTK